jgi:hypothetical protein
MKTKKPTKNKIVVLITAFVLTGFAAGYAFYSKQPEQKQTTITTTPTAPTRTAPPFTPDDQKTPTQNEAEKKAVVVEENKVPQTSTMSVFITRAGQIDTELQVRAFATGTTTGTCALTLTGPSGQKVLKSSVLIREESTTMCSPLNIPVDELPAAGTWKVSLVVKNQTKTSAAATTDVQIKKQ